MMVNIPSHLLPDGFTSRSGLIVCPCGYQTELDGEFRCDKHENPLPKMGLI